MRNHRYLAFGLLSAAFLSIGPAMAWANDGSIVLDFVRHGESGDMTVVNTWCPVPTSLTPVNSKPTTLLRCCRAAE